MADALINYTDHDGVALIQMNDGKVNAISYQMLDQLMGALDRAEESANAIVLTGQPGRFCAGFDLKTMMASPQSAVDLLTRGCDLYMRLYGFSLPVVIACSGHAVAGGALLTLCGDQRIGIDGDFKIGLNEVAIKMPLPVLAMELARERLSTAALSTATLAAKLYSPDEAVTAGYLDSTVAPDSLITHALSVGRELGQLDRSAFKETKRRLRGATISHILATLEADMATFAGPAGN
ncbi:MAG: crotonase/enoyl-CoA hydratase family protein [Myxococcota bacterium]|nr:crotonase/enoyl-CoA hydratase family protein [Myxococcota bacterium]